MPPRTPPRLKSRGRRSSSSARWCGCAKRSTGCLLRQRVRKGQVEVEFGARPPETVGRWRKAPDRYDELLDPRVDIGITRAALDGDPADRAVVANGDREDRVAAAAGEKGRRQEVEMSAGQRDEVREIVALRLLGRRLTCRRGGRRLRISRCLLRL